KGDANVEVETSQFAVQIQRACVAGSAAMIQEDPVAVQRFFLTIHHAARIIAGDAQQRRELALVNEQYKEAHGKGGDAYSVLGKLSKDRIKGQVQINKVIQPLATQTLVNQLTQPQINHEQAKIQVQPSIPVLFQVPNSYGSQSRYVNPKQLARAAFFLVILRIRERTFQEKPLWNPPIRQLIAISIPLEQLLSIIIPFITASTSPDATIPITISIICTSANYVQSKYSNISMIYTSIDFHISIIA
ncbi:MAG: hypothetical protein EZS28_053939, partial [Streblomastix strix]